MVTYSFHLYSRSSHLFKKIIESKIEAEAATKNVRSKIKSYIHEKQNLREGFKETVKPLIESQDKVKESVDKEQNELIKQLQKNQLALTEGLDKNRFAITQGFDKMDEIKKWDLQQLPGYEGIEEPEKIEAIEEPEGIKEDENPNYFLSINDLKIINGDDPDYQDPYGEKIVPIRRKTLDGILSNGSLNQNKYVLNIVDQNERLLKVKEKPIILTYDKNEMDKNLMNKESIDLLNFYSLELPSKYKEKSWKKSQKESSRLKDKLKNVSKYDHFEGKRIAYPKNKNPSKTTLENITEHILENYNYNLNLHREFKEKTGTGILHFNNPLQLLDRLELLSGSILAGNNGVIQEFSQIVHLLNQMKVITKKQLNDLLKKYILNK